MSGTSTSYEAKSLAQPILNDSTGHWSELGTSEDYQKMKGKRNTTDVPVWLLDAVEIHDPLNVSSPVWVKQRVTHDEKHAQRAQWHPYCEIGIVLKGGGISFVENERHEGAAGEVTLLGPGIPHWGKIEKFPLHVITIYFLPLALIETGPQRDCVRFLHRFTAKQSLDERIVRPPQGVFNKIKALALESLDEFENSRLFRDTKLRTLLMEMLTTILRWEESKSGIFVREELDTNWSLVMKALQYLREHYSEPIYAADLCRSVGASESTLKIKFHKALGCSWVKYLQGYRVHRAAALIETGQNVTDAALAVGYESIGHFNKTFRSIMGTAPKKYRGLGI